MGRGASCDVGRLVAVKRGDDRSEWLADESFGHHANLVGRDDDRDECTELGRDHMSEYSLSRWQNKCDSAIPYPDRAAMLASGPLRIVGSDAEGEVRVGELRGHPFFVGTLYVP